MRSLARGRDAFKMLARFHDRLGWDNFVEGRVSKLWLEVREAEIAVYNIRTTAESWTRRLIRRLLELTYRQWIYRNVMIHTVVGEGLTMTQHEKVMSEVAKYAETNPLDLLPENRQLLEIDFAILGDGSTVDKQYWVAKMASVVAAADHIKKGTAQALRSRYCTGPCYDTRSTRVVSMFDSEGSIRWRRRRRRRP
jgi:hypothetical protein